MSEKSQRLYSLRKSRKILNWVNDLYKDHWEDLSKQQLSDLEASLASLDGALLAGDREEAHKVACQLESFANRYLPGKNWIRVTVEFCVAIAIAVIIAIVIRQVWFELYQIPTGSMRPTFKEQDHLLVSKTSFGINVPLQPKHLMFDPDLIERTGVVILTAENLDVPNADTKYFLLFNAKKRYVKRLIGKPGDSLYFYGGKIYGVDADGNDLTELRDAPWMTTLEHIPFSTFDGKLASMSDPKEPSTTHFLFHHMNKPVGRLTWTKDNKGRGELLPGKFWIDEKRLAAATESDSIEAFSQFWGMRNFAMSRLLTKQELAFYTDHDANKVGEAELYLELNHTPGLTYPPPRVRRGSSGDIFRILSPFSTVIPLNDEHLERIMDNLYTARFVVKGGRATAYHAGGSVPGPASPRFDDIEDGTYEFYFGRAYRIGFGGTPTELPSDHPLYRRDPEWIQTLYNLGIEFSIRVVPHAKEQPFLPSRYAYFRNGDLYTMGAPLLYHDDPVLADFHKRELDRKMASNSFRAYIPFEDHGEPMKGDEIDADFIRTFGITVPEGHYFVLGDNHAMSADSRYFGMVPEDNLRGTPLTLIWPWDERLGPPPQVHYPLFTTSRVVIWMTALLLFGGWYAHHRWRMTKPTFVKVTP